MTEHGGASADVGGVASHPTTPSAAEVRKNPTRALPNHAAFNMMFSSPGDDPASRRPASPMRPPTGAERAAAVAAAGGRAGRAGVGNTSTASNSTAGGKRRPTAADVLKPDPIMGLAGVLGFSGHLPGALLFSADGSELVYACASLVLATSVRRAGGMGAAGPRAQRNFLGHTAPVATLALSRGGRRLASAQTGPQPTIRVWDFATGKSLAVLSGHASRVTSLTFSDDGGLLAARGCDAHRRVLLLVWDVSKVEEGCHMVVARQVSDFPVSRIRFSPYDVGRLVSCGRENIRFWRVTKGHLRGSPVVLNQVTWCVLYPM